MIRKPNSTRGVRLPKNSVVVAALQPQFQAVPGWNSFAAKRIEEAIRETGRHLKGDPNDGKAWELLGLELRSGGKSQLAADAFERASLIVTLHPLSRILLAESYALLGHIELAQDLYLLAADSCSQDTDLLLTIASGLEGLGNSKLALELARRAGEVDPQSGQVAYDISFYTMRCGCSAYLAESLCWKAVELEPDNVDFRIGLATLLVRLGKTEQACVVLRKLEREGFARVTCRCCLERIADLYRLAGTSQQLESCLRQLEQLSSHSSENT